MPGHELLDPITSGWTATGIQSETVIGGITDIGLVRLMRAPAGLGRAMTGANSLQATGRATAAGWSTIIDGTAIAIAISATITAMTTADDINRHVVARPRVTLLP